jgi:predicted enzyme related to lactoylglutathione lyase
MTSGLKTILIPTTDVAAAKAFYTALLGGAPTADEPYYVGYDVAGQQIGLVPPGGPQSMSSPVAYWHVDDIEGAIATVLAAGGTEGQPVRDVGGGRLVATVIDPEGNAVGLLQDRA